MNNDTDLPLGDPTARAFFGSESASQNSTPENVKNQNLRPGDTGLGNPNPTPSKEDIRILSEAEQSLIAREYNDELEKRFNNKFSEITNLGLKIPASIYRTGKLILILLSGVLGLFILSEGITIYNSIVKLPPLWKYVTLGAGVVFSFLIVSVVIRLFIQLFGLKQSPQLNLKALSILEERGALRLTAQKHVEKARVQLTEYLNEYPLNNYPLLYSAGFSSASIKELENAKNTLLDNSQPISAHEWLDVFNNRFQKPIETVAKDRIKRYAGKVALGTAASPVGIIDQIIVLYGSLAMIKDILILYNLRPAFGQSAVMLSKAIMQAYLSGILGEATESGVETLSESYEEWSGDLLAGSISGSLKSIFSKTAEAGLNGFLLWRLGKATITHVQMINNSANSKTK